MIACLLSLVTRRNSSEDHTEAYLISFVIINKINMDQEEELPCFFNSLNVSYQSSLKSNAVIALYNFPKIENFYK